MSNEPVDMIVPMLREIRGDIREMRDDMHEVKQKLDRLELGQKNFRNAPTADTLMSKFLIGDFEERLADLERKFEEFVKPR